MKLACSYNPCFHEGSLSPYENIQLMELGIRAYKIIFSGKDYVDKKYDEISLSLHISRSPITEEAKNQDAFIAEKIEQVKSDEKVISIGFHLCNDRMDNIGRYGFSSHYIPSSSSEANASRFIGSIKNVTGKDVWIENANFYSSSQQEIIASWRSFSEIIAKSNANSIIDLSHLIIDCSNNDLDPCLVIGLIDWSSVVELHLSGIVIGADGTLHDGHSTQVSPEVWTLLKKIRQLGVLNTNIYCNIEHSDHIWGSRTDMYLNDFKTLESIFNTKRKYSNKKNNAEQYARSYLKTLISEEITNLADISTHFNLTKGTLLDSWLEHVQKEKYRLSLSRDDMDSEIKKKSVYFLDSFVKYIDQLQK